MSKDAMADADHFPVTFRQNTDVARIKALEDQVGILLESAQQDEKRIVALAAKLAKQRAVNEAMFTWWFGDRTKNPEATEQLRCALREALK